MVKGLLRFEGFAVLLLSLFFFRQLHFSWLTFGLLILTPDISMVGYLINPRIGSFIYNLIHTYSLAVLLVFIGQSTGIDLLLMFGVILAAHIGADRMLGYGLKYPTEFKETHLQRI
jgi:hypothetical protein